MEVAALFNPSTIRCDSISFNSLKSSLCLCEEIVRTAGVLFLEEEEEEESEFSLRDSLDVIAVSPVVTAVIGFLNMFILVNDIGKGIN